MEVEIDNFTVNVLGTVDFNLKTQSMKKKQNFSVYPIDKDSDAQIITIQSETRIGKVDMTSGRILMSPPRKGGSYFVHLQMGNLQGFKLDENQLNELKTQVFMTTDPNAGRAGIVTDNSGAFKLLEI